MPFTLTLPGRSTIPHPAERALLALTVTDTSFSKDSVTANVLETAKHISTLCRSLSPVDSTPEAKAASALAHWTQTSLSATSYLPFRYSNKANKMDLREYNATVKFDIRFKDFEALGPFAKKVSSLPHVEVPRIDWILTPATRRTFQSRLRTEAAANALQKAKDYCEVLCDKEDGGEVRIRPLELTEGNAGGMGMAPRMHMQQAQQMQMQQQQQQMAPAMGGSKGTDEKDESELEFRPQEVRMSMDVTVKFAVDTLGVPMHQNTPPAKRQRTVDEDDDEDMETVDFDTL